MKLTLAQIATRIEKAIVLPQRRAGVIDGYLGYATPDHLLVRGRVLASNHTPEVRPDQSLWRNFRQMVRLFITDEVAGVRLRAEGVDGVSDEEGYFTLALPRGDAQGRIDVSVQAGEVTGICTVIVPDPDAAFGVISDIDDTMMQTGAYSLWRNVWTSLTGNVQTRHIFPDAVALMAQLHDGGRNPVFFVSSSPWNFHGFLRSIFARSALPDAPMFLRDYGISETQFITGTHGDHKGQAIDTILAANPNLSFILIGDSGQHDAQVYGDAIARHPGRIKHVILRQAGTLDAHDAAAAQRIRDAGVPLTTGADYSEAIKVLSDDDEM